MVQFHKIQNHLIVYGKLLRRRSGLRRFRGVGGANGIEGVGFLQLLLLDDEDNRSSVGWITGVDEFAIKDEGDKIGQSGRSKH